LSKQNIYDNKVFFEGYKEIRKNSNNANNLIEKPAINSLLPKLNNFQILDLGCGYGESCISLIEKGAKKVVGIDISEKMLDIAKSENHDKNIEYLNMAIEDLSQLNQKFDLVFSSLAIHYINNYVEFVRNSCRLLNDNGILIFSQEHPLSTCFSEGKRWTKNESNKKIYANISNYSLDGERGSTWFVDNVKKYHRSFSTLLNTLIDEGFEISKVLEPIPQQEIIDQFPEYEDSIHKPDFLIIKAIKSVI